MIDKFFRAFVRDKPGVWFCREVVHITGPGGPASTTPGVTYIRGQKLLNGYDVAEWLDTFAATGEGPVNVNFL